VKCFNPQILPTVNRKRFFANILCIEFFCSLKTHNRTLLFGNLLLKHSCRFDYWNQPLNMHMRVCHQVIHIENHLHSLQLFYFQFLPIY
jgi:hypothetical protein